jgi:Transposase domain (DUF772)
MKGFVQGADRQQTTLLPECLDDWVGESNPVRAVDAFVDALELRDLGFDGVDPAATGRPAYHPSPMLKLYIYGYLNRVQSSRRLEREAGRNLVADVDRPALGGAALADPPDGPRHQCCERDAHVRWMRGNAMRRCAEDRMNAIEALDGVAALAAFAFVAACRIVVKIVATRALHQVAADRRHITNLR